MFGNWKFNNWGLEILLVLLVIFLFFPILGYSQAPSVKVEKGVSVTAVVPGTSIASPAAPPPAVEEVSLLASVVSFGTFHWKVGLGVFLGMLTIIVFFVKTRRRWRLALLTLFKGAEKI